MSYPPRPLRTYRPMPADAFNQTVAIVPVTYPISPQGATNPVPGTPVVYLASVQPSPSGGRFVQSMAGNAGGMPESSTAYEVLFPYLGPDAVIQALGVGDQIEWGDKILEVLAPAKDSGGLGTVWHFPCEVMN